MSKFMKRNCEQSDQVYEKKLRAKRASLWIEIASEEQVYEHKLLAKRACLWTDIAIPETFPYNFPLKNLKNL